MLDYVPRYGNENIPYDDSSKILFFMSIPPSIFSVLSF